MATKTKAAPTKKKQIITVNPKLYGIEESKAKEIAAQFKPMLEKMESLEGEFNKIVKLPIEDAETSAKAKELRLKYVKVRTGTADIHKEQKSFYLSAGRFIDGWKNTQLFASQGIEDKLENIEKHQQRIEEQRVIDLQQSREKELALYNVENVEQLALGLMTDAIWSNFVLGMKTNHKQKEAAELKAEQDRIALEKKDAEEREAQRLENIRLKQEAEKKEAALEQERAKAAAEKIKADAVAKKIKAEAEKLREESEKKLKAEQDKAASASAKLRAKEDEEKRIAAEKVKAEQVALAAPDKVKLVALAAAVLLIAIPEVKSAGAKAVIVDANTMIEKLSKFIREKSAKI